MLIGLTFEETEEFRRLDDELPYNGDHVWPCTGLPEIPRELRWLELWNKHQSALADTVLCSKAA